MWIGCNIANQNIGSSSSSSSNEHCQATHTRPHPFFFSPINPVSSLRNSFLRIHHLTPPIHPPHKRVLKGTSFSSFFVSLYNILIMAVQTLQSTHSSLVSLERVLKTICITMLIPLFFFSFPCSSSSHL